MCGIAGFIGDGSREVLEKMTNSLSHRGPDDFGLFFENSVGLGHRRLSIIDLSPLGHQPMFLPNKSVGIVFNGEIYNFKVLKEKYLSDFNFISSSDTEVILAMYEKFGEGCFEKLSGMFAIALYDFEKKKLIIARDRLGKKPLYWGIFQDNFIFASELKALILHPSIKREIDPVSLELYLSLDYVPTPRSIYKNIFKLEHGSFLVYENSQIRKEVFWSLDFTEKQISFSNALSALDTMLKESISRRLISDVPVGVFLSGGLDSSTIAYYSKLEMKEKLHTFSIGFSEKSFDETKYSDMVSKHLGTVHHHRNVSAKDCLDVIPEIADILDEPVADASIVPTYLLSKFAKEKVTVVLGGDGGDELFAGYPTITIASLGYKIYKFVPNFLKEVIKKLVDKIPASEKNFGFSFNIKKFVSGISPNPFKTHQNWLGSFDDNSSILLLKDGGAGVVSSWLDSVMAQVRGEDTNSRLLGMYMRTYMMDEVLVKVDRASMKASLETRSPFLDYELVDFVNSLPFSMKQRGFTGKYILKQLVKDVLPKKIVFRKKKGFGIPLSKWLKKELKPLVEELLSKDAIEKQGTFNYKFVKKLLNDHFSGRQDNRKQIWNLLVFQMWFNKYMN